MKSKPAGTTPPVMAAALNPVGVDVTPSRDEMAKKAYFLNLNQARPQGRKVPIEWWDTGAQTIECHRNVCVDGVRLAVKAYAVGVSANSMKTYLSRFC